MSGIGGSEFFLLLLIGLIILGPKRLPQVANQIGGWIGQARRMTRAMKRQLEDELNVDEFKLKPFEPHVPSEDDTYSPIHDADAPAPQVAGMPVQSNVKASGVALPDDEEELSIGPPVADKADDSPTEDTPDREQDTQKAKQETP
ncbi:MAG: Sec-independent protein translocase protein TatB [Pseudomonadota bacterium]